VNDKLVEVLDRISDLRIAVIGDFMLDEFSFGEISRVSREAPVLILRYQESRFCPGGAANTVANVASLGAMVTPVGSLGDDDSAEKLVSIWPQNVSLDYLVRDSGLQTTKKTRILAGSFHSFQQQVVRMDYESPFLLNSSRRKKLTEVLNQIIPETDAIIISDYSLGAVDRQLGAEVIEAAREYQIPVIVDSRDRPNQYPGATAVTPNISEVEWVKGRKLGTNEEDLDRFCPTIRKYWSVEALLVTRGKLGMSLFTSSDNHHIAPFGIDDAVDVTGAGDTVAAVFTASLAAGAGFFEAAFTANIAGGVVVTKKGTATVSTRELKELIRDSKLR
jgi:rfaE bifunctional protein kinase chain/domain